MGEAFPAEPKKLVQKVSHPVFSCYVYKPSRSIHEILRGRLEDMTDNSTNLETPVAEQVANNNKPKAKTRRKKAKQQQPEDKQQSVAAANDREKTIAAAEEKPRAKRQTQAVEPSSAALTLNQLWEKRKFLIEVAAVLVIFLTAIFVLGQQHIMQATLDAIEADHRPWVGLHSIMPVDRSTSVLFQVVNSGHSPALNAKVKIYSRIENGQLIQLPVSACGDDCTFRGIEMLPNVPFTARLPKIEEAPIPEGTPVWYIARIDYDDANGRHHKTGICLIKKDADTRACPIANGNYAD
jgi:hypothetical protein